MNAVSLPLATLSVSNGGPSMFSMASTFAAQSQTVIEYRRPVMIGVKAAANYSSFLKGKADDAALPAPPDAMWGYSFGISFDIPVTSMLDLYMKV